ncbi:MAG: tripartite tricarboxylate transporter substrate-binding protein, partial [Burkholderiales bacterium]|nr:tripartite tricarboxylate transporter substrate-binding protein [Burkholderiales bacterium]
KTRSPLAPQVPTFLESGLAGFEATTWFGVAAPAGTPREIVDRLNLAMRRTLADAALQQSLLLQGMTPQPTSPQEFGAMIRTDHAKWGAVIKSANITAK